MPSVQFQDLDKSRPGDLDTRCAERRPATARLVRSRRPLPTPPLTTGGGSVFGHQQPLVVHEGLQHEGCDVPSPPVRFAQADFVKTVPMS